MIFSIMNALAIRLELVATGRAVSGEGSFWLPRQGSTLARDVDLNWDLVFWISVFFFALVTFLMFFFVIRFRARKGRAAEPSASHNTPLEILWSVIPTLLVMVLFWQGYKTFLDFATPPQNSYEVLVTAQKWNWQFTYPNGYVDANLHVPKDTPVQLVMSSEDVIHSFYVPEFRVKRDVFPGRYSKIWFEANELGEYDIFCTEYCGTEHSSMLAKLVVHELADFDSWLEAASDWMSTMSPAEAGQVLYEQRGCKQCHSVDGATGIGPTFLGLFGRERPLADGSTITVDENYIRESILEPQARIAAGYDPVMPTYQGRLKEEEITAIIEYQKTLSD
jgi:cytochrome c oxidase subunit 2